MSKRILCVDDSISVRQIVKSCLENHGYKIEDAVDGDDGLEKANANKDYVLFIVDYHMPNMDGITFVKELRKIPNYTDTPVIMLTTESMQERKAEGKEAGANGWIIKPFDPAQFTKVINRLVGN